MADSLERLIAALAGRYRVDREIGHGGMATVYLAEDVKHRRRVAIKVLDPELSGVLGPERFVREIATAAQLQHPHILPLLDSGAENGVFYYVMPYIEGQSLRARLEAERQLPLEEAVRLTSEVARALDYAHRQGIVHRDIKPENILLADGQAVVADFGIARAIQASGGERLTATGVTLGSPPYMSPEQIAGRADVDGRSDTYGLGCVLYEMLAGQPPFTGPPETLGYQHLNLTPRPIRELRPSVSQELDAAIGRSLGKTPADRYASSAEFAAALVAAPRGAPLVSPGPTPATARNAVPPRASRALAAGVALVIVAVLAIGFYWWRSGALERKAAAVGVHRRWVWLADFDGPAEDPGLAPAAHDLVAAALDESKVLATVPIEQMKIALRNSGRPDTSRIGPELARQLAFRSSIPVVLEGRIARIGSAYSVLLRASNAEDGRLIESATGSAAAERDLLPTLTRLARELRQALGERSDAFRTTASWTDAPTPSFDAFKLFRLASAQNDAGNSWAALALFRQAIAVDSAFATAWVGLGTSYSNLGQEDSSLAAMNEALRHPDRLTPIRRLDIRGKIAQTYHDLDAAIEAYDGILALDPSPVFRSLALNNKALALNERGQLEEALDLTRQAAAVLPVEPTQLLLGNITDYLLALRRLPEARAMLPRLHGPSGELLALEIAMIDRSWDRAESLAVAMESAASTPLFRTLAGTARASAIAGRGEFERAEQLLESQQRVALSRNNPRAATVIWFERRAAARFLGRPLPEVPAELRATRWGVAAFASRAAQLGDSLAARRAIAAWPESVEAAGRCALSEQVEAAQDARHGRWDRVIERLRANAVGGTRTIPTIEGVLRTDSRWLIADAFEKLGQPDSAVTYLGLILEPPALETPHAYDRAFWEPFVRSRIIRIDAQRGRLEGAERQWEALSAIVTRPDPTVAVMLDETRLQLQAAQAMRAADKQ